MNQNPIKTQIPSYYANIYIAGDISVIKQVCREYCYDVGLCVTVQPIDYIYTGGEEKGAIIGLINYPRFPADSNAIYNKAETLGYLIQQKCCQKSFSIITPDTTTYYEIMAK